MSNDTIPKVIFVVAIIICIIILLLKPSTPSINQEPKTPEKFIKNFNSKVQSSSENTKLNKIRLGKPMKNVFKRCLKLLTLFSLNNENLTTNFIKDNVIEYRELNESAFKRSFERDKALLKDMGFLLDFEKSFLLLLLQPLLLFFSFLTLLFHLLFPFKA